MLRSWRGCAMSENLLPHAKSPLKAAEVSFSGRRRQTVVSIAGAWYGPRLWEKMLDGDTRVPLAHDHAGPHVAMDREKGSSSRAFLHLSQVIR